MTKLKLKDFSEDCMLNNDEQKAICGGQQGFIKSWWIVLLEQGFLLAPMIATAIVIPLAVGDEDDDAY